MPTFDTIAFGGKVAVVTGAADGIGRAGARVILADIDAAKGEGATRELEEAGAEARFVATDVADSDNVRALVDAVKGAWGRIDILVNNAAIALPGSVTGIAEEVWHKVIDTNLGGVLARDALRAALMIEQGGGAIVSVGSMQGQVGFRDWSAYATAKGGVEALTRQAAVEYAPHGVRVNAVAPGTIMTPMNERIFATVDDPQALIEQWNALHALGRFGQPQEVADAIAFLASDAASFITGETVRVEGGMGILGG